MGRGRAQGEAAESRSGAEVQLPFHLDLDALQRELANAPHSTDVAAAGYDIDENDDSGRLGALTRVSRSGRSWDRQTPCAGRPFFEHSLRCLCSALLSLVATLSAMPLRGQKRPRQNNDPTLTRQRVPVILPDDLTFLDTAKPATVALEFHNPSVNRGNWMPFPRVRIRRLRRAVRACSARFRLRRTCPTGQAGRARSARERQRMPYPPARPARPRPCRRRG